MTPTGSRKRKRTAGSSPTPAGPIASSSKAPPVDAASAPGDATAEPELTEADISAWNSFCEEYHDIVEQLPLELKRSFLLVHELEEAMQASQETLRTSLLQYIAQKRIYDAQVAEESAAASKDASAAPTEADADGEIDLADSLFPARDRLPTPTELTPLQKLRALASEAAKSSRVAIRAGEDKVQQAVAMYDSVDRHIRRLDADLAKYEDSLVIGLRSGTLPSTEAPSLFGIDSGTAHTSIGAMRPSAAIVTAAAAGEDASRAVRVRGEASTTGARELRQTSQAPRQASLPARTEEEKRATSAPPSSRKRKGPKPKQRKAASSSEDVAVDPNEPTYCYCNRVSFGEMVACDNDDCPKEWFHLECAGLKDAPRGRWYCRDCIVALGIQPKRRK